MKKEVIFYSEDLKVVGDLYYPADYKEGNIYPIIILCHGFAGIKQVMIPPYAEKFTQAGFLSLIFDYRGFGESEGTKGRLVPAEQIVDIRNAISFVRSLPEVNSEKIGLWGTSFGGANAISVAAVDKRVKCIVSQLAFGDGERSVKGSMSDEDKNKLDSTIEKAWERTVVKNKPLLLNPDQILTDEESKLFYQEVVEQYPEVKVKIPLTTLRLIMEYKPERVIGAINIPILLIAAEKDVSCPVEESKSLYDKANNPKNLFILKGAKHYDTYKGDSFDQSSSQAVQWFKNHLL